MGRYILASLALLFGFSATAHGPHNHAPSLGAGGGGSSGISASNEQVITMQSGSPVGDAGFTYDAVNNAVSVGTIVLDDIPGFNGILLQDNSVAFADTPVAGNTVLITDSTGGTINHVYAYQSDDVLREVMVEARTEAFTFGTGSSFSWTFDVLSLDPVVAFSPGVVDFQVPVTRVDTLDGSYITLTQAASNVVPFTATAHASNGVDFMRWFRKDGQLAMKITPNGNVYGKSFNLWNSVTGEAGSIPVPVQVGAIIQQCLLDNNDCVNTEQDGLITFSNYRDGNPQVRIKFDPFGAVEIHPSLTVQDDAERGLRIMDDDGSLGIRLLSPDVTTSNVDQVLQDRAGTVELTTVMIHTETSDHTVLASESSDSFVATGGSDIVFQLPTAVAGLQYCFFNEDDTAQMSIRPATGDEIIANVTLCTATTQEAKFNAQFAYGCFVAIDADRWAGRGKSGTLNCNSF